MELIILGSGTSIPLTYRASPSIAMMVEDSVILFDIGPGTLRQLSRVGIDNRRIKHIFISHFHPDHTADLIHFLFVTRNPSILKNRKPFIITGPGGIKAFINKLGNAYGNWLDIPEKMIEIQELEGNGPEKRSYDNYSILSYPVAHSPGSLAYRVYLKSGKSFVYSGDTAPCDGIIDAAKNCDLLILECSFPEESDVEGHLTPSQAGRIATLSGTKKMLLFHFYPEVLRTDIAGDCRKTYSGELILGRDLLQIFL